MKTTSADGPRDGKETEEGRRCPSSQTIRPFRRDSDCAKVHSARPLSCLKAAPSSFVLGNQWEGTVALVDAIVSRFLSSVGVTPPHPHPTPI